MIQIGIMMGLPVGSCADHTLSLLLCGDDVRALATCSWQANDKDPPDHKENFIWCPRSVGPGSYALR